MSMFNGRKKYRFTFFSPMGLAEGTYTFASEGMENAIEGETVSVFNNRGRILAEFWL